MKKAIRPRSQLVSLSSITYRYCRESLEIARKAEKKAKDIRGKNALAITISKRSGEDYTVAGKWGVLDSHLQQLIGFFRSNDIPRGMAYKLREMAQRLTVPKEHPDFGKIQDVIRVDAVRILKRKLEVPKSEKAQDTNNKTEILEKLKAMLGIKLDKIPEAFGQCERAA